MPLLREDFRPVVGFLKKKSAHLSQFIALKGKLEVALSCAGAASEPVQEQRKEPMLRITDREGMPKKSKTKKAEKEEEEKMEFDEEDKELEMQKRDIRDRNEESSEEEGFDEPAASGFKREIEGIDDEVSSEGVDDEPGMEEDPEEEEEELEAFSNAS